MASNSTLPARMKGQIEDVAASPNDPLFIFHHAMMDCIFDEWLRCHSDAEYPVDPLVTQGHRQDDFVGAFFTQMETCSRKVKSLATFVE